LAVLASDIQSELNRISQNLAGRIKDLAERYATPLPELSEDVEILSSKVEAHLKMMGFAWK
jgi:type I restriction enzyme M protein